MQVSLVIGYSPVTKGICSGELQVLTSRLKRKGRVSTSLTPNTGMKNPDSTLKYHIAEIISLGPQAQYYARGGAKGYPLVCEAKLEPGFLWE